MEIFLHPFEDSEGHIRHKGLRVTIVAVEDIALVTTLQTIKVTLPWVGPIGVPFCNCCPPRSILSTTAIPHPLQVLVVLRWSHSGSKPFSCFSFLAVLCVYPKLSRSLAGPYWSALCCHSLLASLQTKCCIPSVSLSTNVYKD